MSLLGTVYRKELRETLRDRRTLAVMILLPLVMYPLMSVLAAEWFISHETTRQARKSVLVLTGDGADKGPVFAALSAPDAPFQLTVAPARVVDKRRGVRELAHADAIVVVSAPAGVEAALAADGTGTLEVQVYYDASSDTSSLAEDRVSTALAELSRARLQARLEYERLPPAFVKPISLTAVSLASKAKVGRAEVAKTLPFVIVLMVLMGAFYPAIDLTAGEKERGTLEPLLATPAKRRTLLAGKLLTVATISGLTGLLNLLCMAGAALWIARSATRAAGSTLPLGELFAAIPWGAVLLGVFALAVATLLFAGLMMAVASLARSFKEAQNYLTPVYLVATMPALVSWLPGTKLDYGVALVPIANVTLLLKDALAGTLMPGPALVALLASCGWAAAALALAAKVYDSERLLFAPEATEVPGQGGWRRLLRGRDRAGAIAGDTGVGAIESNAGARPSAPAGAERGHALRPADDAALAPGEALTLFAVCALLLLGPGAELQATGLLGVAASLWLCLALPVVLAARWRTGDRALDALGLRTPRLRHLAGATLVGASGWIVLVTLVLPVQEALYPTPKALEEALRTLIPEDVSLAMKLFAVAITPAICEELLCRGALLRSFVKPLGATGAVVVSSLLFALLHLSAYRFVPTFLLGLALGTVALASRSLWPAMLVHALNNASVVILTPSTNEEMPTWPAFLVGPVALAILATGFALIFLPRSKQR